MLAVTNPLAWMPRVDRFFLSYWLPFSFTLHISLLVMQDHNSRNLIYLLTIYTYVRHERSISIRMLQVFALNEKYWILSFIANAINIINNYLLALVRGISLFCCHQQNHHPQGSLNYIYHHPGPSACLLSHDTKCPFTKCTNNNVPG